MLVLERFLGTLTKDHFAEELNTILAKLENQQEHLKPDKTSN